MTPQQLSAWYAEKFNKESVDWHTEKYKINLVDLDESTKFALFQNLQQYLSRATYYTEDGKQIEVNSENQDKISFNFYFNTLSVPNIEILKALYAVTGQ